MNNSVSQLPEQFYYQELFSSLIRVANRAQKEKTGLPMRVRAVDTLKHKFMSRVSRAGISSEDCLKTLYSLSLIDNSSSRIPLKKSEVKNQLVDKLSKKYKTSEYCHINEDLLSIKNQINLDFPSYSSFNDKEIEGKGLKSDNSVREIEGIFFDIYGPSLTKDRYLRSHPVKRALTLRHAQKAMRYKAPMGTSRKLLLAGLSIATAAQLASFAPITKAEIDTTQSVMVHQVSSMDDSKDLVDLNENQSVEQSALDVLYANPSQLSQLGVPYGITQQFEQYVKQKQQVMNGVEFTAGQKEEYDSLRQFLIDSITTTKMDNSISNSFYTYPDSLTMGANNGVQANVSFSINGQEYSYTVMDSHDVEGFGDSLYGSDLAQSLSYRDTYLSKKSQGHENSDNNGLDDLDSAIDFALKFAMSDLAVDKETGMISENINSDIMSKLDSQTQRLSIEHDVDDR